jgi:hypothetical protein
MTYNRLGNQPPKVEVVRVSVEEIRNDRLGGLVQEWAALSFVVFGEPPWDNEYEIPRLIFGIGVDMMRDGARGYVAQTISGRHIGHTLGYEVFRTPLSDPRRISLQEISGVSGLDYLLMWAGYCM